MEKGKKKGNRKVLYRKPVKKNGFGEHIYKLQELQKSNIDADGGVEQI